MYHRFEENKYPSTNIRINDFKEHIDLQKVDMFSGNILWSSLNQMQFNVTSRKDDLMSIAYMSLMLLNSNQFPLLDK